MKIKSNIQIARDVSSRMKELNLFDIFKNNPKINKMIYEYNNRLNNIKTISIKKYRKMNNRLCNKITKILLSTITKKELDNIINTVKEKFTPEELTQLEIYQDSKEYWTDNL